MSRTLRYGERGAQIYAQNVQNKWFLKGVEEVGRVLVLSPINKPNSEGK